jgi:hypothetical protein
MREARYAYPKYRFTGLIEFVYRDYTTTSKNNGRSIESGWTSFEQRYRLGLKGYIYHPKLITYSASITYVKDKTDYERGGERDSKNINYYYAASILKTLPVSLDVYGSKVDSTNEATGVAPYDISSNSYGARLSVSMRKYPSVILEYDHWEYTIEREKIFRVTRDDEEDDFFDFYEDDYGETEEEIFEKKRVREKTSQDRFGINVKGFLKAINTNYYVSGDLSEYTSPSRSFDGKNLTINTNTLIKKSNRLYTYFQYYDIDYIKQTRFSTTADLSPIGRLSHSYKYEYFTSDSDRLKAESHAVSNYLGYRFSSRFFGTARFRYRFGKMDGVREDIYDIYGGLNYTRPIRDYDFASYYSFAYDRKESDEDYELMQNSLGVSLSTRKIIWGKIYSNYDFSFTTYDFSYSSGEPGVSDRRTENSDSFGHRFRVGMNRKLPGRAYYNIEAEVRIVDSDTTHARVLWYREEQWAEKIRHYTFTGDAGYPIGLRGLATFKASYTIGETNSENVQKYYYEGRFNYRLLRNLNFLAWWREDWRNKGWWAGTTVLTRSARRAYGWKTREYQIQIYYLFYKATVSLEYNSYKVEEGPYETDYKRLYLRVSKSL